jgi:dTDP-4-dehydrorhamnose reductase
MRHAVLGAPGQLGRELCPLLPDEVVPLGRDQADLTDPAGLAVTLTALRPDVVLNCAAYNLVDRAEAEPEAAFAVNAWGPCRLARVCRDLGCLLVHFSTDYVYGLDEGRDEPYAETDAPGPLSVYGLSKLTGEYFVRQSGARHLIIRTCGLYGLWGAGGKGTNFIETMLRLAAQGKPLRVVADQRCTPTSASDVARATVGLLAAGRTGLFHVTNAGSCTWHELAASVFELAGVPAAPTPITSKDYGAPARRPAYSVLAPAALAAAGLPPLRPWREALADYLRARQARRGA